MQPQNNNPFVNKPSPTSTPNPNVDENTKTIANAMLEIAKAIREHSAATKNVAHQISKYESMTRRYFGGG